MHPVLTIIEWGGAWLPIGSYGAFLALAALVGAGLALRAAVRAGLDAGAMIAALGIGVGCAFVGAYLAHLGLSLWLGASLHAALLHPGLIFYGGAVFGTLGFAAATDVLGLPLGRALDASVPALPIAHTLGRLGCFLGGCCYGAPWDGPLSVLYTHPLAPAATPALRRHPWPLYESAALLLLALLFSLWPARRLGQGDRFASYVFAYALLRALLEPLRGDTVRGVFFGGLVSTSQLVSALLCALVLGLALAQRARPWRGLLARRSTV